MLTSLQEKNLNMVRLGIEVLRVIVLRERKPFSVLTFFISNSLTHPSVVKYDAILLDTEDLGKADFSMKIYASGHL